MTDEIKVGDLVEHREFTDSEWSEAIWEVLAIDGKNVWIKYFFSTPRTTTLNSVRKPAPKPVVNLVVMQGGEDHRGDWGFDENQINPATHKITFNIVDGVPDCNSIRMEKL